jgi:transposase
MAMIEQEQARVGEHENSFDRISASDIADSRMHFCRPDAARPIGHQPQQGGLFTYVSCEERVPEGHPLRTIRAIADEVLEVLTPQLEELPADVVGPAIAPEKLMRSLLLEALYTIPSERQLIEQLGYNLLFRWFVRLSIGAPTWDAGVFNQYRKRLLTSGAAAQFLVAVISQPRVERLLSSGHFSIDTALIEAWTRPNSSELRDDRAEPPQLENDAEGDLYGENGERMPYYPARPRVSF